MTTQTNQFTIRNLFALTTAFAFIVFAAICDRDIALYTAMLSVPTLSFIVMSRNLILVLGMVFVMFTFLIRICLGMF